MTAYIGEIRLFAGNFAPAGWEFCHGQILPISENDALFSLIGTTYGGDGQENFALPNLASRVPLHVGTGPSGVTYQQGEMDGAEAVTLSVQQIPVHTHPLLASHALASSPSPQDAVLAQPRSGDGYLDDTPVTALHGNSVTPVGGSQPHDNMQPSLGLNYIISLYGIFPPPA